MQTQATRYWRERQRASSFAWNRVVVMHDEPYCEEKKMLWAELINNTIIGFPLGFMHFSNPYKNPNGTNPGGSLVFAHSNGAVFPGWMKAVKVNFLSQY